MSRPRNGSLSPLPNLRAPSRSLMPYSVTMPRAIWLAFSMSLAAPVVGSWKTSSSAVRPPTGDDRDLVHGVGVRQRVPDQGVPALVVGDELALPLRQHDALALGTRH